MKWENLKKISDYLWEIPQTYRPDMRVPARIFASEQLLRETLGDRSLEQLVNVTTLPGIQVAAYAMPDIHEGYGFPIGGVAAMSTEGIISPGGIGYDINCGVRMLVSDITFDQFTLKADKFGEALFRAVPSGVGASGHFKVEAAKLDAILEQGANWVIEEGYGDRGDGEFIESGGMLANADPLVVSQHAKDRGRNQLGTMGAGNHFVEVNTVEQIFEEKVAQTFRLFPNQIVILIHCGSRGLGHQVATDYIRIMLNSLSKYNITLPDRELAGAPFTSQEGQDYFKAMAAAANFAWVNRQLIAHQVGQVWQEIFGQSKLSLLYDVSHNIAKLEEHNIDGHNTKVVVHRKGATRSFPNQPVLIPGSMGTASYVLVGTAKALELSFGSTCHGAGRRMSRHQAKEAIDGRRLKTDLDSQGIHVFAGSISGVAEEAPTAYKDIDEVVRVVDQAGLAKKIARLKPVLVVKG